MDQVRPLRIIEPQRRAAFGAKTALAGAGVTVALIVFDPGAKHADGAAAFHFQTFVIGRQIDGETAAALCLATDRTIAKLVGIGRMALDGKMYRAAAAGTFQQFGHGSPSQTAR